MASNELAQAFRRQWRRSMRRTEDPDARPSSVGDQEYDQARTTRLEIHSRPARDTTNAYTALLADSLERQGLIVRETGHRRRDMPFAPAVLLFHWPTEFYRRPRDFGEWISDWLRLAHLAIAKAFAGLKIVWTAHNTKPHSNAPETPPLRWRAFLSLVDGVISLSADAMDEVLAAYPQLCAKPRLVTTHGHYLDLAITPARLPPAPGDRPLRLAALGSIRANKRFADLARAVAASPDDFTLSIQGVPESAELAEELSAIAASCPRIALAFGRLSDTEWEAATDAADLIVLPYADILNSGVLFHALSRYRPVVAPRRGSIPAVREQVGGDWIHLFEGQFGVEALEAAANWLRATRRDSPPDLSAQDWDRIGSEVAAFLEGVADSRASG